LKVVHIVEALGELTPISKSYPFFQDSEIKEDIDTTIIYSANRKEVDSKKIKGVFKKSIAYRAEHGSRIFALQDLKSLLKLIKELRRIQPDVIHLHSSKAGV
jgi:hypothetical protein